MDIKKITNFIFELGQLKRQRHAGFQLAGVKNPDSVAEHVLRAAQIGYVLAVMEGDVNPEKVVFMVVVHDNAEARVGDQHKVAARYYRKKEGETEAFYDQLDGLGEVLAKKWEQYNQEYEERETREGVVAKDADWLEIAFQAKEYYDTGYRSAYEVIENIEKALETGSAGKLIAKMKKTEFTDWWQGLKQMTYQKLDSTV